MERLSHVRGITVIKVHIYSDLRMKLAQLLTTQISKVYEDAQVSRAPGSDDVLIRAAVMGLLSGCYPCWKAPLSVARIIMASPINKIRLRWEIFSALVISQL